MKQYMQEAGTGEKELRGESPSPGRQIYPGKTSELGIWKERTASPGWFIHERHKTNDRKIV